jgi:electron transfer flavoprotein beta subunit
VTIKQVASLDDDYELLDGDDGAPVVDPDFIEWELNEWDTFSLEAALQLAERDGGEVVVVTVGDDEAEEGILGCLARGAARGVRVWDDALEGADTLAVARVLAAAVERESPDLVLCGVQSSDAVNGATGVALAAHLDLPYVAVVNALEVDGTTLTVKRELEDGLLERVRLSTPALLTIQTGINEPRYASMRALNAAREQPLDVLGLEDLGLDDAAVAAALGRRVRALAPHKKGQGAEMLAGSSADVAARIAEIVKERLAARAEYW